LDRYLPAAANRIKQQNLLTQKVHEALTAAQGIPSNAQPLTVSAAKDLPKQVAEQKVQLDLLEAELLAMGKVDGNMKPFVEVMTKLIANSRMGLDEVLRANQGLLERNDGAVSNEALVTYLASLEKTSLTRELLLHMDFALFVQAGKLNDVATEVDKLRQELLEGTGPLAADSATPAEAKQHQDDAAREEAQIRELIGRAERLIEEATTLRKEMEQHRPMIP
jgi:hypothetical protein